MNTFYLGLFIIIAVIVLIVVISLVSNYRKKERNKKLFSAFDDFVVENKLTIDKKQTLNRNIIGLDRLNGKLIFIDNSKEPQQKHLISLQDLAACNLKKERNTKNGNISEIYLHCVFKENKQPDVKLPVYNSATDDLYKMMRLSKKASYWEKTINIFREVPPVSLESQ
jgi:hypothetical protein